MCLFSCLHIAAVTVSPPPPLTGSPPPSILPPSTALPPSPPPLVPSTPPPAAMLSSPPPAGKQKRSTSGCAFKYAKHCSHTSPGILAAKEIWLETMVTLLASACIGLCGNGSTLYTQVALSGGLISCPAQAQISGVLSVCLAAGAGYCCCRGNSFWPS